MHAAPDHVFAWVSCERNGTWRLEVRPNADLVPVERRVISQRRRPRVQLLQTLDQIDPPGHLLLHPDAPLCGCPSRLGQAHPIYLPIASSVWRASSPGYRPLLRSCAGPASRIRSAKALLPLMTKQLNNCGKHYTTFSGLHGLGDHSAAAPGAWTTLVACARAHLPAVPTF